ncbi:nucleotide exchange factor GrpE [Methanosalsum natronophilum]|uniref:Protein GrpE n=1 Tax=Methanosalsum natronophilum TaxID=768733 RepID=A0A3R7X813_9EURY|nr:nucleotide exchange factor GrpE [Methanosalsum natronophilum]MCS3923215.1 molecular chaperone GrpE [Methanosalsum natronophilum]RQD92237.1 MAG: nucleotide exchange factor GrpE [Methanosalsum natronophilum]
MVSRDSDKDNKKQSSDDLSEEKNGSEREDTGEDVVDVQEYRRLEAENQELNDKLMRLAAEFENFRKRSLREKEEYKNHVVEKFVLELLDVVDNFERALKAGEDASDTESVVKGVEMVYKQLYNILEKNGVEKIICESEEFDPHMHEAVMQVPSNEHPENTVVDVCQTGYKLDTKVIRPAMVTIAKQPDEENETEED